MTAQALRHDLAARGVILTANGDQLTLDGPDAALTDELLETLRDHKGELLALLRLEPDAEACPVCHGALQERRGKQFRHLWCPRPGHFDAWRAMNGLKLKDTDAPIFPAKRKGARR